MLKPMIAAVALATAAPLAPAALADGLSIRVSVGQAGYDHYRVDRNDAVRIAYNYGLARVTNVDFDHGRWEIDGRTRRGTRVEMEVSARTGRILDVDYYRRGRGFDRRGRDHRRFSEDRGVTWTLTQYESEWDRHGPRPWAGRMPTLPALATTITTNRN